MQCTLLSINNILMKNIIGAAAPLARPPDVRPWMGGGVKYLQNDLTSHFLFKLCVKMNTLNSSQKLIRRIKDLVYKFYKMKIFSGMIVFIILVNIFNGSTSKYHYWGKCIEFHFHNLDGAIQIIMPKKYNVNSTVPQLEKCIRTI